MAILNDRVPGLGALGLGQEGLTSRSSPLDP